MMDHPLVITIDSWDVYHSQSWVLYDIVIPFKKTMIIDISSIKHDIYIYIYIYLGERYQWITGIGLITMGLELSNYPSWHHSSKLHQKPWPNHGSVGDEITDWDHCWMRLLGHGIYGYEWIETKRWFSFESKNVEFHLGPQEGESSCFEDPVETWINHDQLTA